MNHKLLFTAVALSLGNAATASAAVLQQFAGGTVTQGNDITFVTTATDTNDWIATYNGTTASGTLYYKFDVTINNNAGETGGGGFYTGLSMYSGTSENFGVGNQWQSLRWGSFLGGGGSHLELTGPQPYVVGQTETLVVKVAFNASAADDITIFFNPVAGVAEGDQLAAVKSTRTTALTFDNFRLRAGNGTGSATYSDIVFATTFADVNAIPEPSAALLGALGLLALLRRRR